MQSDPIRTLVANFLLHPLDGDLPLMVRAVNPIDCFLGALHGLVSSRCEDRGPALTAPNLPDGHSSRALLSVLANVVKLSAADLSAGARVSIIV